MRLKVWSNAIAAEDFLNREQELHYLQSLPGLKEKALGGDVFLEGSWGIGKTELLRQLQQKLFWQNRAVPFYYSFKTANLKGSHFAKDYFTRFVRQYVSFLKKDPIVAENTVEPIERLLPMIAALGCDWLIDYIEDFQAHERKGDFYWLVAAAISAPALVARKIATPLVLMLDDFDFAERLYESHLGDTDGLFGLFAESMYNRLCCHIITGAAGTLRRVFTDHSLLGMTERLRLGPLPEDLAAKLFKTHLANLQITYGPDLNLAFLNVLRGNPLYIRNLAKAAAKMQKNDLTEKDLVECYGYEVSEGDTAFYWSSIFQRHVPNQTKRKAIIRLLRQVTENRSQDDRGRLGRLSGLSEDEVEAILVAIEASGVIRDENAPFKDFIWAQYLKEIEGASFDEARERIIGKYLSELTKAEASFELVIPMNLNAELVVAKAVEQIGRNLDLDEDFLQRLQLALIEVCINAIEHSGSYEKKIFLKIVTRPDRLEIIIENSGRPFNLPDQQEIPLEEKLRSGMRRGWGFKLVHAIMDEVKVERINDRMRVVLRKTIRNNEVSK